MNEPNADLYLRKAQEMKGMAAAAADPTVREQLMLLAQRYERLAAHADQGPHAERAA